MSGMTRIPSGGRPKTFAFASGEVAGISTMSPSRTWNEDAAVAVELGPNQGVLVLADGAGGHLGSQEVARTAIDAFVEAVRKEKGELFARVCNAIEAANVAAQKQHNDAASTLACVLVDGERVRALHVGDSGVLVCGQRGKRKFETIAHSPVGYALEAGLLTEGEALLHEDRHLVANLLGFEDYHIEMSKRFTLAARDTLLVASDGLLDNLHVDEIIEIARQGPLINAVANLAACADDRMRTPKAGEPSKPDDMTIIAFRRGKASAASGSP